MGGGGAQYKNLKSGPPFLCLYTLSWTSQGAPLLLSIFLSKTIALAVYTRSPAAYEALKGFKLLQLPSVRTLKDYIDANIEDAGECMKRLEEERKLYLAMIEQMQQDLVDRKEGLLCGIHTAEMFILYFPFSEHKVLVTES